MGEDIALAQRLSRTTVYLWLHRFAERGAAGGRIGAAPDARAPLRASRWARSWRLPSAPRGRWACRLRRGRATTRDRLVAYLSEHQGITRHHQASPGITRHHHEAQKRSRRDEALRDEALLDEALLSAGWRWRKQEQWCGERVEPQGAENRGRSSSSPPLPQPAASSSVSTRWVRRRQRASRAKPSSN
jgi:transposase